MAKFSTLSILALALITFCLQATTFPTAGAKPDAGFKKEKLTNFRVFWTLRSGKTPTSIPVIKPVNGSSTFGLVTIFDDALTEGPDVNSKVVGRTQGLYAVTGQSQSHLLMAMNFVFPEGKYKGSTLAIYGDNPVYNWQNVREIPVVAGTGLFRFARGYALLYTHSFDPKTLDATVEFDVYVRHH